MWVDYSANYEVYNRPVSFCIHGPACSACATAEAARKAKEAETKARNRKLRKEAAATVYYSGEAHPLIIAWIDTGKASTHGHVPGPDWAMLDRVLKALDVADARNNAPAVKT